MQRKFALIAILTCLPLLSWARPVSGRLAGTVTDEGDAPLAEVLIRASAPTLAREVSRRTDRHGRFQFAALPPGTYSLTFTKEGYLVEKRETLELASGRSLSVRVVLSPPNDANGSMTRRPLPRFDAASAGWTSSLTTRMLRNLPGGRAVDPLLTILPGITNAPSPGGISIDGASAAENVACLDGIDVTGLRNGGRMVDPVYDFIDEVQVTSSAFSARESGATGGVVHIVTCSGGNGIQGELFGYYSGSALRAGYRDVLDLDPDDDRQAKYAPYETCYGRARDSRIDGGLALGGSLLKDRLWFFAAVAPTVLRDTRTVTPWDATIPVQEWRRRERQWKVQTRLTAHPWRSLRLSATFLSSFARVRGDLDYANAFQYATSAEMANASGFDYPNLATGASADWEVSPSLHLSLHAGLSRTNQNNQRDRATGPCYQFRTEAPGYYPPGYIPPPNTNIGLLDVPTAYWRPPNWVNYPHNLATEIKASVDRRLTVGADLGGFLSLAGDHSWQLGAQFKSQGQRYDHSATWPILFFGWNRDFIAYGHNYGRGKYGYYAVRGNEVTGPYGDYYDASSDTWALYLQDSWTILRRLTLSLGLRAETEYVPFYSDHPSVAGKRALDFSLGDKLSPRLGFAWFVDPEFKWKVSGSYSVFFDTVKLDWAAAKLGGFKWQSAYYSLDTYEWDKIGVNGYYPGRLLLPTKTIDFSYFSPDTVDPALKPTSTRALSFGLERRFNGPWTASLRLTARQLRRTIQDVSILTDQGEVYYLVNPGEGVDRPVSRGGLYHDMYPAQPKAKREYWGLTLALDKGFAHHWQGGLSLTWSSLRGSTIGPMMLGNQFFLVAPQNAYYSNIWYTSFDRGLHAIDGPLPGDRPLVVKGYATYSFPFGLSAGAVVQAMSGPPNSTEWVLDVPGYLPFNRSNDLGRSPFLVVAGLYLEYALRFGRTSLTISANIDNLFDTRTATKVYSVYNQGAVGLPESVLLEGGWDIAQFSPVLDPRYGKKTDFYGNPGSGGTPRQARLGLRWAF